VSRAVATSVKVLEVLFFRSYAEGFSCWVATTVHFIVPENDEPFASLYFHGHVLLTRVFGPIQIETNISVVSLSELQGQKPKISISCFLNS